MTRFFDVIGYGESLEDPTGSGIWVEQITEYPYFGDVTRIARRLDDGESLNSNISVGNSISVVADQYANENFLNIKYVRWAGTRWTVSRVEVQSPRLILTLGEVYNGPIPEPVVP